MCKLASTLILLGALVSSAAGLLVPRKQPPPGWNAAILEPYDQYHCRYLAVECQLKHNTHFFDDCCHPLKVGETLETARKPYCIPTPEAAMSAAAAEATSNVVTPADQPGGDPVTALPTPTPAPAPGADDGDDDQDCDDDEPEPEPAPARARSSVPPAPAPSPNTPVPSPQTSTPQPTPTPTPTPTPQPTPAPAPAPAPAPSPSPSPSPSPPASNNDITGGQATFYLQNGNAGACGERHGDDELIAAIDSRRYGPTNVQSSLCGRSVTITNEKNGRSVTVTIKDACPTCENENCIDLSVAAFNAIATPEEGVVPIRWHFN